MTSSAFEKVSRPATKGEAVLLIDDTYRYNDWGDAERATHQRMIGIEPKPLNEMPIEELRMIVDRFEKSKMVIFRD